MERVDCVVIGAGVVGLAVAAKLAQHGRQVVLLEQHKTIGAEISSRNSEVIHAGIYYPPGSLKAKLCVRGKQLLYDYCDQFHVPFKRLGKLVVASTSEQEVVLDRYARQAKMNGVFDLRKIDRHELLELEPEVRAVSALFSPSTGIVDSHQFMLSLQGQLEAHGGVVSLDTRVNRIGSSNRGRNVIHVETDNMTLAANWVINAGGLHAPKLAEGMKGVPRPRYAIGHYYSYSGASPFSRLVYPVPEKDGLGIHSTLDMTGKVKFGPDVRWCSEIDYKFDDSLRRRFVEAIKLYFPALDENRLSPGYTGIRPKLAGPGVFTDFSLHLPINHGVHGRINLLGIESPGLTSALAIAEAVFSEVGPRFC